MACGWSCGSVGPEELEIIPHAGGVALSGVPCRQAQLVVQQPRIAAVEEEVRGFWQSLFELRNVGQYNIIEHQQRCKHCNFREEGVSLNRPWRMLVCFEESQRVFDAVHPMNSRFVGLEFGLPKHHCILG